MAASRTSFCACARPLVSWAMDDSWFRMNTSRLTSAGSRRSEAAPDAMAACTRAGQRGHAGRFGGGGRRQRRWRRRGVEGGWRSCCDHTQPLRLVKSEQSPTAAPGLPAAQRPTLAGPGPRAPQADDLQHVQGASPVPAARCAHRGRSSLLLSKLLSAGRHWRERQERRDQNREAHSAGRQLQRAQAARGAAARRFAAVRVDRILLPLPQRHNPQPCASLNVTTSTKMRRGGVGAASQSTWRGAYCITTRAGKHGPAV